MWNVIFARLFSILYSPTNAGSPSRAAQGQLLNTVGHMYNTYCIGVHELGREFEWVSTLENVRIGPGKC